MTADVFKWPIVKCWHCGTVVPNVPGAQHRCADGLAGFTLLPGLVTREELEAAGHTVVELPRKDP